MWTIKIGLILLEANLVVAVVVIVSIVVDVVLHPTPKKILSFLNSGVTLLTLLGYLFFFLLFATNGRISSNKISTCILLSFFINDIFQSYLRN